MNSPGRVLVVEDEFMVAMTLKDELVEAGYNVVGMASTADGAVEMAAAALPEVILMDVRLRGPGDGVDAAYRIRAHDIPTAIIFVTASSEPRVLERIQEFGPAGLVFKPVGFRDIDRAIQAALRAGG